MSKQEERGPGRPRKASQPRDKRLSIAITEPLREAIQKHAETTGQSVNDIANEALAKYVGTKNER